MSSSTSSSPISPSSAWIQRPPTSSSSNRRGPTVEPLNLWPPTSTWAAYSSALASLSLGQLATGETSAPIKYPSRCSPLTPTTPTYSPSFSPQQTAVINSFGVHPLLQPDSPHSVTDGACPDFPTAFPLDFCTTNHHVAGHRSPTITTTTNSNNKRQLFQPEPPLPVSQKRSKSFTIDAILGLEEFAASCCDVETAAKHLYHSSQDSYLRSESPNCQQQRRTSLSESPDSSPPPSSIALSAPSSSPRAKRVRTIFSAEQLERLEAEFARQQYMVGPERLVLAASLRLSESQVKVWFQNRRIKWRKQHLESQQMRLVTWRQHEDQQQSSQDHLHHHNLMANGPCMDDDQHSESFSD